MPLIERYVYSGHSPMAELALDDVAACECGAKPVKGFGHAREFLQARHPRCSPWPEPARSPAIVPVATQQGETALTVADSPSRTTARIELLLLAMASISVHVRTRSIAMPYTPTGSITSVG